MENLPAFGSHGVVFALVLAALLGDLAEQVRVLYRDRGLGGPPP
jgi:hypothetical protein